MGNFLEARSKATFATFTSAPSTQTMRKAYPADMQRDPSDVTPEGEFHPLTQAIRASKAHELVFPHNFMRVGHDF